MRDCFILDIEKNRIILLTVFTSIIDMDVQQYSGYRDFMWAVKLHRFCLETIGLWPKSNKFAKRNLQSELHVNIVLMLLIFVCNIPMIYAITQIWGDMELVINYLQTTLPCLTTSVKYIILQWKRTVILSIVRMMMEDWMTFKLDAERNVMIKQAQIARLIMILGYTFLIIGLFGVTFLAHFDIQTSLETNFTDQGKQFPFQTYDFYDTDKSPQYELTYLIQIVSIVLTGTVYISADTFLMLTIFHICGQLENFKNQLIRLELCKNFNKTLNDIITRHLRLIRFADNIENMYSLMMLLSLIHFCIVCCLSCFLCITIFTDRKIDEGIAQVFYSIIIITIILTGIFLYCGAGELVTEKCNEVHRTVCELEWYKLEPKQAKNLILLIMRTNHSLRITAGKIIPLTMATFCNVIKTSTGYISFLLAICG